MDTAQLQPLCHKHESEQKSGLEERQSTREQIAKAGKGCSPPRGSRRYKYPGFISLPEPFPPLSRRALHVPVFQASGACRSDVFTAQEAKAQKTRHMSLWLSTRGSPAAPVTTAAPGLGALCHLLCPPLPPLWHRRSHPQKSSLKGFFCSGVRSDGAVRPQRAVAHLSPPSASRFIQ